MPVGRAGTYRINQAATGAATIPPTSIDASSVPLTPDVPKEAISENADVDATATSAVLTDPIAYGGRTDRCSRNGVTTGPQATIIPLITPTTSAVIFTTRGLYWRVDRGAWT